MHEPKHAPVRDGKAPLIALGLDLGVSSLGWALLELDPHTQEPIGVKALGVRIFPAGVEGDVESGREESRGVKRRDRRLQRRQLWRRARRDASVFHALQTAGLLPLGDGRDPATRHATLLALDAEIASELTASGFEKAAIGERAVYLLRARALDHVLPQHHIGRALYHLAQRRGFQSNRVADVKDSDSTDDDMGKVRGGILTLEQEILDAKARTLGEFLASRSQDEGVRRRYTARQMLKDEFTKIWATQCAHHPVLMTDEAQAKIHRTIFAQRPLKSQRHLVARCELERSARRAMIADPLFQEFRILQRATDLQVELNELEARPLTATERETLIAKLMVSAELTFPAIRKLLELPRLSKFNLERGGEKRLVGNRTASRLLTALGDQSSALSERDRDKLVQLLLFCDKEETIRRVGLKYLGLDSEHADWLSLTNLEPGTAAFSRRALRRLLVEMRRGVPFSTARQLLYPAPAVERIEALPPILRHVRSLRNPAVLRSLTELRHVVNAIVAKYALPDLVRIELARDMKRPRKVRAEMSKTMRARQDERTAAKSQLEKELGLVTDKREDVEKYLLFKECNGECPYTGQRIVLRDLFSKTPTIDVEHIIPYSISLDDSFANKTLCVAAENRKVKQRRSPFDAYSGDEDRWNSILSRVDQFKGPSARRKRQLFRIESIPAEFSDRQLNDTRHASVLAQDYVGLLYGGAIDGNGRRRVQASSGGVTAHVRRAFNLSQLLGGDGEKTRSDHRHHAVDAVAIAATTPWIVEKLQRAAQSDTARPGRTPRLPDITDSMRDEVQQSLLGLQVSHRRPRGNGALHDESLYGRHADGTTVIRKPVNQLKLSALEEIVDPVVRERVRLACAGREPEKAFANGAWPSMLSGIPIKRVRISTSVKTVPVGSGPRERLVKPNGNSHLELFINDVGSKLQWRIVTRLEAYRRRAASGSVVSELPPEDGWRFVTTLRIGDMLQRVVEINGAAVTQMLVLQKISDGQLEAKLHTDSRSDAVRKTATGARIYISPALILRQRIRRIAIDPLGDSRPANG